MIPSTQMAGWNYIRSRLSESEWVVVEYFRTHPGATRNDLDRDEGKGRPNYQGSRRIAGLERKGVLRHEVPVVTRLRKYHATGEPPREVPIPVPAKKQLEQLRSNLRRLVDGKLFVQARELLEALQ